MFGNNNLGASAFGLPGGVGEQGLNTGIVIVEGFTPELSIDRHIRLEASGNVDIRTFELKSKFRIEIRVIGSGRIYHQFTDFITSTGDVLYTKDGEIFQVGTTEEIPPEPVTEILVEPFTVDVRIVNRIKFDPRDIDIIGEQSQVFIEYRTPTNEQYIEYIGKELRVPIYRLEILQKSDESVRNVYEGIIVNNSGSVNNTLDEGVRRTCNFTLENYNNQFSSFVDHLTIGDKFKLYLGYKINGVDKLFPEGVYVFDDPNIISERSTKEIEISGTDKWSMLNGQNGGILEGTYVVKKGTKIGNLIRRTLALNIVNDPIPPIIDKSLENQEITYDITKKAGETVSDIFLEVALNVSAYIYYDENGRLNMYPVESDMFTAPSYDFSNSEYNYLGASKQYKLSDIYNSVLVIGENIKDTNTPIIYEALNNDLSDPNSIPNVGYKKVKMITEYTKGINTMTKAQERANWELRKARAKTSSVAISCLALYHLDVNQVVTLTDNYLNSNTERYLINSIELPIGVDVESTIELVKAVETE